MKTISRKTYITAVFAITLALFANQSQAQVYSTRANGNWTSLATWAGGLVPPSIVLPTMTININHSVTYNSVLDILNSGTINLKNTTGTIPVLTVPSGIKVENLLTGKIYIKDAEYRQYRFVGGGNSGTAQSGSFYNKGGYLEINNSIIEVAEKWLNENAGKRIFKKGVLLLGNEYELKDNNTIDTLDKVAVSLGWHNNGEFKISSGKIHFNQAKIQLAGTNSKFKFNGGTGSGDIDYITFKNHVTSSVNDGDLEVSNSVIVVGSLNLDAYCVTSAAKYKPNGKFAGSQSFDCSMNYFPVNFLIQQTANLSTGLSFTNPQHVAGTPVLAVGAKYKFALVNDTVDAIITIDSLINGATVASIDDNTAGTGYAPAFQPRVGSGNVVGKSYAVFTVNFFKKSTSTPVSIQHMSATPLDIDGGSTLKEFAEINAGAGAGMNYMSSTLDISVTNLLQGNYIGQNILGIERDNIDTSSFINMFTVYNTDMSSFRIKYGTITTAPTTTVRQFSLFMKGFSYAMYSLPVKLSSFSATLVNNNRADLKWVTASEINLSHFVVERSLDGSAYSDAGLVFAYGNGIDEANYVFPDNIAGITVPVIYYRLRSVDADGKNQYSETRMIRLGKKAGNDISIFAFPNPATNEVRISIPNGWQNKKVTYEIININGQLAQKTEVTSSSQTETLNTAALSRGSYIVKVSCEGQTTQQKIVKQ